MRTLYAQYAHTVQLLPASLHYGTHDVNYQETIGRRKKDGACTFYQKALRTQQSLWDTKETKFLPYFYLY